LEVNEKLITAAQLAQKKLLVCSPSLTVSHAAQKMRRYNTSSILVEKNDEVIGIWTEADCTKLNFEHVDFFDQPIEQYMSSPVITVTEQTPFQEIIMAFHRHRVRHLLVINTQNSPVGIVSQTDVIKKQGLERYLKLRKIKDNYNPRIPLISSEQLMSSTVQAMAECTSTSALIENKITKEFGIITERDLLKVLAFKQNDSESWQHAAYPLVTINEEESLYQAYLVIKQNNFRHLVVCDNHEKIIGVLSLQHILSDIEISYVQELKSILTERDDALKESKKHLLFAEKIIEASLDCIMVTNGEGTILSINPAFINLTGYSESEVIGQSSNILSSGKHDKTFYHELWKKIRTQGSWQGEIWNKKKNGEIYPEWLTIVQINERFESEQLYVAIFNDISERKLSEKKIHELAFFDELTKLPNRRLFNDRFEIALSTAHRNHQHVAVLFLDLDRFKQINDGLGHKVGDELLKAVSKRIIASLKEGDTVARFGGDEFVILLTEINSSHDAVCIIERIANVLSEPYELDSLKLQITSSIGAAFYPEDGLNAEILLKHADTAMYKAKENGRNTYQLYNAHMNTLTVERLVMQNCLRNALNNDEFELHYQLQIHSLSRKVVGIEALLRWKSETLGTISPAVFIPMAQELGIIVEIDKWVLNQACKQRRLWQEAKIECGRISVNISVQHFKYDLLQSISKALIESQLKPTLLEIEVTEGCFIENPKHASSVLNKIKDLGIHNAIDDFGTGFSALSYLTQLPFDTLKIDGSFITKLVEDKQQRQIVSTIIAMAKGLGLSIVAEGVETEEQLDYLTKNGCFVIQGYLFSVPKDATTTTQLINELSRL